MNFKIQMNFNTQYYQPFIKQISTIILMFVGDVNQAIYSSLGGVAKGKKELENSLTK